MRLDSRSSLRGLGPRPRLSLWEPPGASCSPLAFLYKQALMALPPSRSPGPSGLISSPQTLHQPLHAGSWRGRLSGPREAPWTGFLTPCRPRVTVWAPLPEHPMQKSPALPALTLLPVPPLVFTLRCLSQTSSGMYAVDHCLHSPLEGKVLCFIHLGKILLLRRPPVKTCWMDRQKIRGDSQHTNKHTHKWKRCTGPVFGRWCAVLPSLVGGGLPYA